MNSRAQGEVSIREALREVELWGAGATFHLTDYEDSSKNAMKLIKEWKDLLNEVLHGTASIGLRKFLLVFLRDQCCNDSLIIELELEL